ncbi:MAG TPA: ATP-binding protein [Verrucomicrobiae bacterium]|nr:ATP-binding protein [Verrucomicrobiae bacterium]
MILDSRVRLIQLLIAAVLVIGGLVWAERAAWRQISNLRTQLQEAQVKTSPQPDPVDASEFFAEAETSLRRLQQFLFITLLGLAACGILIMVLVYRRTIAPLRSNLTQSLAVIERHEKLASLGVLAAGIAHEIRNPLTAIKVRLFTLKSSHQAGTSEHEDLEVIRNEIDRLERIVSEFLQFARPAEPNLEVVSIEKLLRETLQLLESELRRRSVEIRLVPIEGGWVKADADKIKQVLINLVQNGAESIEHGGIVTLAARTDSRVLGGAFKPVAIIEVSDNGSGIAPETQKRLFDPFFTTKEEGTGLGLAIAARIVEKHGGVIEYETAPNRGTTFSIILPLAHRHENEF